MAIKKDHWIGFDLGGTKMLATVFDKKFKEVASRRRKTKEFHGVRAGAAGIIKTIEEALGEAEVSPRQLVGIGIGCPGVVNLDQGMILHAPNLGWRNMPLRKVLEKKFPCPVILSNDVDAGTFAEWRAGAAQGARCVVGVFPGTGIGGACVYEGKLLRGRLTSCMELGHLHMRAQGQLCGCGQRGCLETLASRLAISARAAEAAYRGNAPYLLEHSGTTLSSIRSRALAKAIAAGDEAVEDIVNHAAKQLGLAIVSVVNLLAPDVVILGGGLIEALSKPFLVEARQAVEHHAMRPFRQTRVVIAKLGDDAAVLGSALLAAEALKEKR